VAELQAIRWKAQNAALKAEIEALRLGTDITQMDGDDDDNDDDDDDDADDADVEDTQDTSPPQAPITPSSSDLDVLTGLRATLVAANQKISEYEAQLEEAKLLPKGKKGQATKAAREKISKWKSTAKSAADNIQSYVLAMSVPSRVPTAAPKASVPDKDPHSVALDAEVPDDDDDSDVEIDDDSYLPIAGEVLDIIRRAVAECKEPVKLINFLDSYMHSSYANGLFISNNRLLSTNLEEDARLEEEMSKEDTRQGLTRWIALVMLKDPKAGKRWRRMVSRYVFTMVEDTHPWPVQRRYIELLRPVTVPQVKDMYPNWKVTKLWSAAKRWVDAREKEKLEDQFRAIASSQLVYEGNGSQSQSFLGGPSTSSSSSLFRSNTPSFPSRRCS